MRPVYLATTNEWKVQIAKRVIEAKYGITVKPRHLDVVELQHDDPAEIARASVKEAYRLLGAPVIKCDSGLSIPSLGGFPGPYSNYVQRTLGVDGLLQICEALEDRRAAIYSVVAYCDGYLRPATFYGEVAGTILREKQGVHGYFFDSIFVPAGLSQTLAHFDDSARWVFWKGPFEAFAEWYVDRHRTSRTRSRPSHPSTRDQGRE